MQIFNIFFLEPLYFFLFFFFLIFLYFFFYFRRKIPIYPSFSDLNKFFKKSSFSFYLKIFLIFLIFSLFLFLLSNPNKKEFSDKISKDWIDIVLAFDLSTSMLAPDLSPNRLESAKKVLNNFLSKQKTNRVWLVIFAWKPFVSVPLTFDYNILKEKVSDLEVDDIDQSYFSWTAVWDAILLSKNIFKKEEKREKVIIVLTDGDSNSWIDPKAAALSIKDDKIKIFTIWIWSNKETSAVIQNWPFPMEVKIKPLNWQDLKEIAEITSWEFFRATDDDSLKNIFEKLNSLEKNKIEVKNNFIFSDLYDYFAYFLSFLIFLLILLFLKINIFKLNK